MFGIIYIMKNILIIIVFIFLFSFFHNNAYALRTLPQARVSKTAPLKTQSASIGVAPRIRNDRHALVVYFSNLQNAQSISYMLIYKTNGQDEGAGGSVKPSEGNATRELLFGTCSKNVCRYHTNISKMTFEVTAQLKSGKKLLKRYKIKI